MLIKQDEEFTLLEGLREGNGLVRMYTTPLENGVTPFTFVARLEMEPKAKIGFHVHEDDEEVYAIVSGSGIYYFDGGSCAATPGDVFTTRKGMSHALENIGDTPLVFFAAVAK